MYRLYRKQYVYEKIKDDNMSNHQEMKDSEYEKNLEMGLSFFNNLQYEMFAFAFSLLFAGELKDVGDNVSKDEPLVLDPSLLALSTDKNVQLLGELSSRLGTRTAYLASHISTSLKTGPEILQSPEAKKPADTSALENNDYDRIFLKCVGILIEYSFGIVSILENFVTKASNGKIAPKSKGTDLIERIDALRPYSDENMIILLDMASYLESTLSKILYEDASGRGLLKNKSAIELIGLFKGE